MHVGPALLCRHAFRRWRKRVQVERPIDSYGPSFAYGVGRTLQNAQNQPEVPFRMSYFLTGLMIVGAVVLPCVVAMAFMPQSDGR
jgi:hypothetical protein